MVGDEPNSQRIAHTAKFDDLHKKRMRFSTFGAHIDTCVHSESRQIRCYPHFERKTIVVQASTTYPVCELSWR